MAYLNNVVPLVKELPPTTPRKADDLPTNEPFAITDGSLELRYYHELRRRVREFQQIGGRGPTPILTQHDLLSHGNICASNDPLTHCREGPECMFTWLCVHGFRIPDGDSLIGQAMRVPGISGMGGVPAFSDPRCLFCILAQVEAGLMDPQPDGFLANPNTGGGMPRMWTINPFTVLFENPGEFMKDDLCAFDLLIDGHFPRLTISRLHPCHASASGMILDLDAMLPTEACPRRALFPTWQAFLTRNCCTSDLESPLKPYAQMVIQTFPPPPPPPLGADSQTTALVVDLQAHSTLMNGSWFGACAGVLDDLLVGLGAGQDLGFLLNSHEAVRRQLLQDPYFPLSRKDNPLAYLSLCLCPLVVAKPWPEVADRALYKGIFLGASAHNLTADNIGAVRYPHHPVDARGGFAGHSHYTTMITVTNFALHLLLTVGLNSQKLGYDTGLDQWLAALIHRYAPLLARFADDPSAGDEVCEGWFAQDPWLHPDRNIVPCGIPKKYEVSRVRYLFLTGPHAPSRLFEGAGTISTEELGSLKSHLPEFSWDGEHAPLALKLAQGWRALPRGAEVPPPMEIALPPMPSPTLMGIYQALMGVSGDAVPITPPMLKSPGPGLCQMQLHYRLMLAHASGATEDQPARPPVCVAFPQDAGRQLCLQTFWNQRHQRGIKLPPPGADTIPHTNELLMEASSYQLGNRGHPALVEGALPDFTQGALWMLHLSGGWHGPRFNPMVPVNSQIQFAKGSLGRILGMLLDTLHRGCRTLDPEVTKYCRPDFPIYARLTHTLLSGGFEGQAHHRHPLGCVVSLHLTLYGGSQVLDPLFESWFSHHPAIVTLALIMYLRALCYARPSLWLTMRRSHPRMEEFMAGATHLAQTLIRPTCCGDGTAIATASDQALTSLHHQLVDADHTYLSQAQRNKYPLSMHDVIDSLIALGLQRLLPLAQRRPTPLVLVDYLARHLPRSCRAPWTGNADAIRRLNMALTVTWREGCQITQGLLELAGCGVLWPMVEGARRAAENPGNAEPPKWLDGDSREVAIFQRLLMALVGRGCVAVLVPGHREPDLLDHLTAGLNRQHGMSLPNRRITASPHIMTLVTPLWKPGLRLDTATGIWLLDNWAPTVMIEHPLLRGVHTPIPLICTNIRGRNALDIMREVGDPTRGPSAAEIKSMNAAMGKVQGISGIYALLGLGPPERSRTDLPPLFEIADVVSRQLSMARIYRRRFDWPAGAELFPDRDTGHRRDVPHVSELLKSPPIAADLPTLRDSLPTETAGYHIQFTQADVLSRYRGWHGVLLCQNPGCSGIAEAAEYARSPTQLWCGRCYRIKATASHHFQPCQGCGITLNQYPVTMKRGLVGPDWYKSKYSAESTRMSDLETHPDEPFYGLERQPPELAQEVEIQDVHDRIHTPGKMGTIHMCAPGFIMALMSSRLGKRVLWQLCEACHQSPDINRFLSRLPYMTAEQATAMAHNPQLFQL